MLRKNHNSRIYQYAYLIGLFLISIITFNSCEIIGDIFEAGVWTGIIIIIIIVALLIYIFSKFRRRN